MAEYSSHKTANADSVKKAGRYRFDIKAMSADCEANYARINRLLCTKGERDLRGVDTGVTTLLEVDMAGLEATSVAFYIVEQCAFTTSLNIAVQVEGFGEAGVTNMSVRLYHDVTMAEVIACNRQRSKLASYQYPNESMFQPDEKAQQNRFLAEWLSLCLARGRNSDIDSGGLTFNAGLNPGVIGNSAKSENNANSVNTDPLVKVQR